ncbi:MAG: hypothetical protein HFE62_03190 [Firmicutes bacterium]|nr:hypothetical protein [Bacillota bacterium]
MNEENKIYEIARMIDGTTPLNDDVIKAFNILRENFQNNYVRRLVHAAGNEAESAKRNPSREIVLLRALKNFGGANSSANIDAAIQMLTTFQAINSVQYKLNGLKQTQTISMKSSSGSGAPAETISNASINIANVLLTLELLRNM